MIFSDIVLRSVLQQQQRFHHFRDNFQILHWDLFSNNDKDFIILEIIFKLMTSNWQIIYSFVIIFINYH